MSRGGLKGMTIEQMWLDFARAVRVPEGGVQWRETRNGFYAGFTCLLQRLKDHDGTDDSAVRMLQDFESEIGEHVAAIARLALASLALTKGGGH